jgi:radical SAM protein with 4Fe4S-binding SPASM domain
MNEMSTDTAWKQRLKSWMFPQFGTITPAEADVPSGLYHYQFRRDDGYIRFHLRVERSGQSLLIAGASEAVRVSREGTPLLKRLLEGESGETVAATFPAAAKPWIDRCVQVLEELGSPSSRFPVFNLGDPVEESRDAELIAPFQADVELGDADQLHPILRSLWEAGIPHARFLPTASVSTEQLVQAVEWAEDLGMIAGVRSPAKWLMESDRAKQLAAVGVDYLLAPWAVDPELHRRWFGESDDSDLAGLMRHSRELEVTPVVEIPLVEASIDGLYEHWTKLDEWRIGHVEVYALARLDSRNVAEARGRDEAVSDAPLDAARLRQLAAWVEESADEHAFQVTWLPPVGVTSDETVEDRVRLGPRAGGDVTIRVLPNGDVLPPRGARRTAGNLLSQTWEQIWGSSVFRRFRERVEANTRCEECPGMVICAADCPADPRGWSHE